MKPIYLCSLFALAATAPCSEVVFSDFGPGDTYNYQTSWAVGGNPGPEPSRLTQGEQFAPSASGYLSKIELGIGEFDNYDPEWRVRLLTDVNDEVGSELGHWDFHTLAPLGSNFTPVSIDVANGPLLEAGQNYWLLTEAAPTNLLADAGWNWNTENAFGRHVAYRNGVLWGYQQSQLRGAFRISVNPVPEPASLAILGIGAVLLRRRKKS